MDKPGLLKRKIRAEASRVLPGSATIGRVTCSADWNRDLGSGIGGPPILYAYKVDGVEAPVKSITKEMFQP